MSLKTFFQPKSVAVVGVSQNKSKLGYQILNNIIQSGFSGKIYGINPKLAGKKCLKQPCFTSLSDLPQAVDLAVVVVPAKYVESVTDQAIAKKIKNLIVISAGFSEAGNQKLEDQIVQKCQNAKINLLGPNCLGAIFPYAGLNASFADGFPIPGKICFVSQSGAFCTAMLDWAEGQGIGFSHFISLGNKTDIDETTILKTLKDDPQVELFVFYLESMNNGQGFLKQLHQIAGRKPVVILEPGSSADAAQAVSSHTGSLAPNHAVLKAAYRQAGAIQVESMEAMFGLVELLSQPKAKNFGPNTAIITNAGGVGVLSTDLSANAHLNLPTPSAQTLKKLEQALPSTASTHNPIDLVGDADEKRYEAAMSAVLLDKNFDQILILLTPQTTTEVEKTARAIVAMNQTTDKNVVASFIGGHRVNPGREILIKEGVPHFDFPVNALEVMGLLADHTRQRVNERPKIHSHKTPQLQAHINHARDQNWPSLAADQVQDFLEYYDFTFPQSENFTDFALALEYAQTLFPKSLVLKISAPQALHKTDVQGVILNVDSPQSFTQAWDLLKNSIKEAHYPNAKIQIQNQIPTGTEVIVGINKDPSFGHTMLFGAGGIYTEVWRDTSLRVLPTRDFKALMGETHVWEILQGTRGQEPKAIQELENTLAKLQQMVIDYPDIKSLDLNPVLVTETEAWLLDVKILV